MPKERKARRAIMLAEHGPVLDTSSMKHSTPPRSAPGPFSFMHLFMMSLIFLIAAVLFIRLSSSLVHVSSQYISPINATSVQDIYCNWEIEAGSSYTAYWYNGTTLYNSTSSAPSPWGLPSSVTRKGETWRCNITAYNATDETYSYNSTTIIIRNAPPTTPIILNSSSIDIGTYEPILEDKEYVFTISTYDPDGDSITYLPILKLQGNSICTSSGATITCNGTQHPTMSVNDVYLFQVYDGENSAGVSVNFNVTPVNDAPYFSPALTNKTLVENTALNYTLTMADEENSTGPFTYNISSDYNDFRLWNVSVSSTRFRIQFENNRVASYADRGNHTVYLTLCDAEGKCIADSFRLEVVSINQRPNITNFTYQQKSQNENFTLTINATDLDENDRLNFSVQAPGCSQNPWSAYITTLSNHSTNATGIISVNLTNEHIRCRNITLTVTDSVGQTDKVNLSLLLVNANDYPTIFNISFNSTNTNQNRDIRNLTAYTNLSFRYNINATDIDMLVNSSESINYTYTESFCQGGSCPGLSVGLQTGVVTFMPNVSHVGNFSFIVTVTDKGGLQANAVMNITVYENTPPSFNPALSSKQAYEGINFLYDINATDSQGDLVYYYSDSPLFTINLTTGIINFTPACEDIGNYTINVTLSDDKGAEGSGSFNLSVLNTIDSPVFLVLPNRTDPPLIEEFPFYIDISEYVYDADVECSKVADSLNYSAIFLSGNRIFEINGTTGIIGFTPNSTSDGNYLIRLYVSDTFARSASALWNITIVNRSFPPTINNVTPYGEPLSPITVFGWASLSSFSQNMTTINLSEGATIVYDHNSTDGDSNPLAFNWTFNGAVQPSTSKNFSHYFDYSSAGTHNITLTVSDIVSGTPANEVSFRWSTIVENFNRPPMLNTSLPNVTLNTTKEYSNYLTGDIGNPRFNDPDGDTLTYNYTPVTKVSITISGSSVIFTPLEVGEEQVIFTAYDGQYMNYSNNVTINVTSVDEQEQQQGGSSTSQKSSSSVSYVPYSVVEEKEKEKDVFLDIIVPEPITIYTNDTLRQVINLINKGNTTLRGIHISASTNATIANISFSTIYFPEILPGETKKTDLILTSYRLLSKYEIIIWANVTEPKYKDKAVIYVNSIEKTKGNQSMAATKITFAQDLLSSNPECLELNEFIKRAQGQIELRDYEEAANILDSVIQGCKYLVTQSKLKTEKPSGIVIGIDLDRHPLIKPVLILFALGMIAAIVITARAKKMNDVSP